MIESQVGPISGFIREYRILSWAETEEMKWTG